MTMKKLDKVLDAVECNAPWTVVCVIGNVVSCCGGGGEETTSLKSGN